jgi:hypothetical protein
MSIIYHDDKKQKHQSHEARFMIGSSELGQLLHDVGYLDNVGYGASPEAAKADLINDAKYLVESLQKLTADIQELIHQHDTTNRDVGSPCNG